MSNFCKTRRFDPCQSLFTMLKHVVKIVLLNVVEQFLYLSLTPILKFRLPSSGAENAIIKSRDTADQQNNEWIL